MVVMQLPPPLPLGVEVRRNRESDAMDGRSAFEMPATSTAPLRSESAALPVTTFLITLSRYGRRMPFSDRK